MNIKVICTLYAFHERNFQCIIIFWRDEVLPWVCLPCTDSVMKNVGVALNIFPHCVQRQKKNTYILFLIVCSLISQSKNVKKKRMLRLFFICYDFCHCRKRNGKGECEKCVAFFRMDAKRQSGTVSCDLNPCYGLKWGRWMGGCCEGGWSGRNVRGRGRRNEY